MANAQITVNATTAEIARAREELLGVFGSLDAGRPNAWASYGYKSTLSFADFFQAYSRGGAGFGAVHRILDKCWQELPRIKRTDTDEETDWERKLKRQISEIDGWQKLRDLDRRNMVGCYAAIIYRVRDGLALREPMARASQLVDIVPVYEEQLKVTAWHSDSSDADNYGKPAMFQYRARRPGANDTQGKPDEWVDVHPSRIQILAEGSVGDDFLDGVPLLRAGFNNLVDLEKISGGSAESFLKNSARTIVFNYDPQASVQAIAQSEGSTLTVRQIHEEQTRALNRNQESSIVLQGGDAKTLQTTVSDPSGAFQLAANLFAASVQLPFTVLFGQQTGRLASDEDKADYIARCKSRQTNELTPMLKQFVRRMQAAGIVEPGEFEIEWPPLDAPGDDAKMGVVNKMTASMQQAFQAGLTEPLFDANELRKAAGYEERTNDGMPTPDELAAGLAAEQAAIAAAGTAAAPPAAASA